MTDFQFISVQVRNAFSMMSELTQCIIGNSWKEARNKFKIQMSGNVLRDQETPGNYRELAKRETVVDCDLYIGLSRNPSSLVSYKEFGIWVFQPFAHPQKFFSALAMSSTSLHFVTQFIESNNPWQMKEINYVAKKKEKPGFYYFIGWKIKEILQEYISKK